MYNMYIYIYLVIFSSKHLNTCACIMEIINGYCMRFLTLWRFEVNTIGSALGRTDNTVLS